MNNKSYFKFQKDLDNAWADFSHAFHVYDNHPSIPKICLEKKPNSAMETLFKTQIEKDYRGDSLTSYLSNLEKENKKLHKLIQTNKTKLLLNILSRTLGVGFLFLLALAVLFL